jgi:mutator protein MutT
MSYTQELRALLGHRPLILVGAAVLIFNDQRQVLMQHRTDDNRWDFPGGFMEPGETIEETARREIREETGLEIGEMVQFKVYSGEEYYYEYPNGDQVYPVIVVHVTADTHGSLRPDGLEGSEVKFFPIRALPDGTLSPVRRILEDFLESSEI